MKNKKNHIFLLCEKCKHNGRCRRQKQIPTFCLKGCIVEEKEAKDNKPQTIHEFLVKDCWIDGLIAKVRFLLDNIHHEQCTFENEYFERLRNRHDKKFEEYNKAVGLERSAMCLVEDVCYFERAVLYAALTAYIEKLEGER